MANDKKMAAVTVASIVEDLKSNPSKRFSKSDYQTLVYAICADKDFKVKKYVLRGDKTSEEEYDVNAAMSKLFDKLLKHAGMSNAVERQAVVDSFSFNAKDVEWVAEAVDEAMFIYSECDKNLRIFRDRMLQLTIRKIVRSGKYAGKTTYKKMVLDRTADILGKLNK